MNKILTKAGSALLFAVALSAPTLSFANLTITPTLVVIEGRNRYADVNLINDGNDVSAYSVGWRFFKQTDVTGMYADSTVSTTDFDLTKNVVYTPKRMTLPPNELQKIRLGLRLKGEPPAPGDYRAHLELKEDGGALPPDKIDPNSHTGKTSVGLKINVGFSIPVIYRVGEPDVQAIIGDVKTQINPHTKKIELVVPVSRMPKESKFGLLGHFKIYYSDKMIGEQKNANLFPEANSRIFTIPLDTNALNGGTVHIVYVDFHDDPDKQQTLAIKDLKVGK